MSKFEVHDSTVVTNQVTKKWGAKHWVSRPCPPFVFGEMLCATNSVVDATQIAKALNEHAEMEAKLTKARELVKTLASHAEVALESRDATTDKTRRVTHERRAAAYRLASSLLNSILESSPLPASDHSEFHELGIADTEPTQTSSLQPDPAVLTPTGIAAIFDGTNYRLIVDGVERGRWTPPSKTSSLPSFEEQLSNITNETLGLKKKPGEQP